jgi:branched-chain amino acid transport system permease protein
MKQTVPALDMSVESDGTRSRSGITVKVMLFVAVVALAAAPHVANIYYVSLGIPFMAYAVALLGFNLLFGYGGQLSFGHALFLAIGAYSSALAVRLTGNAAFELMLLFAVAAALAISIPLAWIASRFSGIFFGMLTLSFGMLFYSFLNKFYDLTGGDSGMNVSQPSLLGIDFSQVDKMGFLTGPFYYYCLALLIVSAWIMWRIVRSPYGLHLQASRDNEVKASYLGVKVRQVRAVAFVISAIYGSVGGAMLAISTGLADPELSYWQQSGHLVFMAILGGYQEFIGPVAGALIFILLQDELQAATQYWRFFLGVVLALLVIGMPGGLLGTAKQILARWRR